MPPPCCPAALQVHSQSCFVVWVRVGCQTCWHGSGGKGCFICHAMPWHANRMACQVLAALPWAWHVPPLTASATAHGMCHHLPPHAVHAYHCPCLPPALASHSHWVPTFSSPLPTELGIYPAVDPLDSTSRMLNPRILGDEHYGGECPAVGAECPVGGRVSVHWKAEHVGVPCNVGRLGGGYWRSTPMPCHVLPCHAML